jgi:putative nucleotidyltransferase with HDIG domain
MLVDGSPVRAPHPAPETEKDLGASATVVSEHLAPSPGRHLPHMLTATTIVAVLPLALSLGLRASGVISSGWLSVGLAVALSLAASSAGSAYWRKRSGNGEVVFGELLLWGWIRRRRQERELADATRLLDLVNPGFTDRQHPCLGADDALTLEQREQLLRQLAGALEGQDVYLNGHSRRVARHATMIARRMGLSSEEVARVRVAAAVHDVGKLRTPKAILNKPGRLTDAEFEVVKRHPVDGAEMVAALGDPELTRIVRHHHERLDGAGYPAGLTGDEIPLGARIIAVADTFDAITSARPYRDAAPHQKAIDILRAEAGAQLDPDAVRAFLAYYSGSRPTVVWAIVTSSVRRLVSWLSGDPAAAASLSASKVATATAVTAAIGAAAGAAPVPVHHHPPRHPAAVRTVRARPGWTAPSLGRTGHVVTAPAVASGQPGDTAKPATARTRRGTARGAAAPRQARHGIASRAHRRAGGNSASNGQARPTANRGASSRATLPTPGQTTGAPSPTSAATQGAANAAGGQSSQPRTSQSHGSSANGNSCGHTKPLGNGHGNGNGGTHADTSASAPAAAPTNSQGNGQGSGQGHSQGTDQGNGKGLGSATGAGNGNAKASPAATTSAATAATATAAPATATPTTTASSAPAPTAADGATDNGAGSGHGNHTAAPSDP